MGRSSSIRQQVGASPAEFYQTAFLVGTEGAETLRIGVHPDDEVFPGAGIEFGLVVTFGLGKQDQQGAGLGEAFTRFGEALAITVLNPVGEARLAVVDQRVVGLGGDEVEASGLGVLDVGRVAGNALLIEHGLDQAIIPQGPGAVRPRG
jgi:hypothetical protein